MTNLDSKRDASLQPLVYLARCLLSQTLWTQLAGCSLGPTTVIRSGGFFDGRGGRDGAARHTGCIFLFSHVHVFRFY